MDYKEEQKKYRNRPTVWLKRTSLINRKWRRARKLKLAYSGGK